jgi:hypothetical protein
MRRAVGATLCLALGLATTVAISWLVSLQSEALEVPDQWWRIRIAAHGEGEGWLRAHNAFKFGWRQTFAQATGPGTYPFEPTARTPDEIIHGRARRLAMPWLDGLRPWPSNEIENYYLNEYGWPLAAMYARNFVAGRTDVWDHTLNLQSIAWFSRRPSGELRGLPIGILWEGLLLGTGLWSLAWAVLLLGPNRVRRHLRERRGACLTCGYDLRTLPSPAACPECGAR